MKKSISLNAFIRTIVLAAVIGIGVMSLPSVSFAAPAGELCSGVTPLSEANFVTIFLQHMENCDLVKNDVEKGCRILGFVCDNGNSVGFAGFRNCGGNYSVAACLLY